MSHISTLLNHFSESLAALNILFCAFKHAGDAVFLRTVTPLMSLGIFPIWGSHSAELWSTCPDNDQHILWNIIDSNIKGVKTCVGEEGNPCSREQRNMMGDSPKACIRSLQMQKEICFLRSCFSGLCGYLPLKPIMWIHNS